MVDEGVCCRQTSAGKFLNDHNREHLKDCISPSNCTTNGVADVSLQNLMLWVNKHKAELHWDVAPTGLTSRNPTAKKAAPSHAIPTDANLNNAKEEAEIQRNKDIYDSCVLLVRGTYAHSHSKNASRREELASILKSYRNKPLEAEACIKEMRKKIYSFGEDY